MFLLFRALLMKLDVTSIENPWNVITIGKSQAEGVIATRLSVVRHNAYERECFFTVNVCYSLSSITVWAVMLVLFTLIPLRPCSWKERPTRMDCSSDFTKACCYSSRTFDCVYRRRLKSGDSRSGNYSNVRANNRCSIVCDGGCSKNRESGSAAHKTWCKPDRGWISFMFLIGIFRQCHQGLWFVIVASTHDDHCSHEQGW